MYLTTHRLITFASQGELSNLRLVDCMRKEDKEKTIHGEMSSPPKVEMVKVRFKLRKPTL